MARTGGSRDRTGLRPQSPQNGNIHGQAQRLLAISTSGPTNRESRDKGGCAKYPHSRPFCAEVVLFGRTQDWLAGAGGIEPPNGGIKIRCLTAWLRPNRRRRGRWKNWHPQIPLGRSRSIGSGAAFQPPGGAKYRGAGGRPGHTLL